MRADVPGQPQRVLAEGRTAVVYDVGEGWVLRRYREPRMQVTVEAAAMRLAACHGVPVPVVAHAAGPDLVLEHIRGPSMLSALLDDPASAFDQGRHLADLHRRLDRVPVPADAGLPTPAGSPGRLLHGDLHPDNVLLAARGPVLIDWANAGSGPGAYDTATTWLVLACLDPAHPDVGTRLARVRRPLLRGFLSGIDRVAAESVMPRVAAARIADPATSAVEHGRIRSFTRRIGGSHDEES